MLVHLLSSQKTRTVTDIEAESQDFRDAKKIILKTNLDRAEMTVEAQANIDKIGYLTQLDTTKVEN